VTFSGFCADRFRGDAGSQPVEVEAQNRISRWSRKGAKDVSGLKFVEQVRLVSRLAMAARRPRGRVGTVGAFAGVSCDVRFRI
jgi:hypothetical protein